MCVLRLVSVILAEISAHHLQILIVFNPSMRLQLFHFVGVVRKTFVETLWLQI